MAGVTQSSRVTPRVGVIAFVPDSWHDPVWAVRHQILKRLAAHFEVVWMEPAHGWREYWLAGRDGAETALTVAPAFTIYTPGKWNAEVFRPRFLGDWLRRRRVIAARRLLESRGCTHLVLYIWRPELSWARDAIPADLTCYHIDDEYQFSFTEPAEDPRETALIRSVGQVIIHSPKLLEKKGRLNPNTAFVPNGVDYVAYAAPAREPADLAAIARPRMGYVGVVKAQLDLAMQIELARAHPEWSFVFIGPHRFLGDKKAQFETLRALPNVHLLGNRPVAELPAYTQHLDVCMMPYEVNAYTNYIYPLKMHEYLASGRPVVSSAIQSVLPFEKVVRIARSFQDWDSALAECLQPHANAPEAVNARRAVAAEHDWDALVRQISKHFRVRLGLEC